MIYLLDIVRRRVDLLDEVRARLEYQEVCAFVEKRIADFSGAREGRMLDRRFLRRRM